jgi:dihydroorotase-like cyclic amidohydrolase
MIAQIGPHLGGGDATIIDAAGMIVMPGLIDTQEAARLKLRALVESVKVASGRLWRSSVD